jgi:hypothetical protein
VADWNWAHQQHEAGRLDEFRGEFVAVLQGRVIGHGSDPADLRQRLAGKHAVDPERLVVLYVEDPDAIPCAG